MNGMLRDLLSERAEAAGSPELDLQDLIAHGERRITSRRRVALGGAAVAVALTLGASFALSQIGDRATSPVGPPSDPPSKVDVGPDTTDGARPLTYGVGATIHYGDRVIEAAEDPDGVYVFDDGLWFFTGENEGTSTTRLYYTDGSSEPVEIARGIDRVTPGEVGSLLVWLDADDVVIYDTHGQVVLERVPLNGRRLANPITPLEDAVYWMEYDNTATTVSDGQLVRYDVPTGIRTPASQADYRAETRTPPLVVGSAESSDPAGDFTVVDARLEVATDGQGAPPPVFVAATGERLRVSVPAQYEGQTLGIFQWLDDDRFALVADSGLKQAPIGDLLECRISAGGCDTVASGEQDWLLPGPHGGVGAEG
jgi:hypothetical protein